MKPYLKWPGSKRALSQKILECMPPGPFLYVEPFVGAGAVFFALYSAGRLVDAGSASAMLTDTNARLIACHQAVRDDIDGVLRALDAMPMHGVTLAMYEAERDALNAWDGTPMAEHAARFIWLNRACFNGLYRENRDGGFNTPWNKNPTVRVPDEITLRACSMALQRATLQVADFRTTLAALTAARVACADDTDARRAQRAVGAVVYADPPYVPVSPTANFTAYTAGGFGAQDQEDLAIALCTVADAGAHVVASNADVPYVRDLYAGHGFTLHKVTARRAINRDPLKRGPVGELLLLASPAHMRTCMVAHTRDTVREPAKIPTSLPEPPMSNSEARGQRDSAGRGPVIVRHVTSSMKGGVDADLDQFTLIIGRNGARKSAHVNAIEFALTRAVSDVVGRQLVDATGPNAWMIGDMVGPADDVHAEVELSDGTTRSARAERRKDGTVGKAKTDTGGHPDAFPLRTVRDALAGSTDTIRQYLLAQAASSITVADIRKRFTSVQAQAYDVAAVCTEGLLPVDQLLAVLDAAKKRTRTQRARAQDQEGYARSRAQELGPEPTEAQLSEAQAVADAYQAPVDLSGPRARVDTALARFQVAKEAAVKAETDLPPGAHEAAARAAGLRTVLGAVNWHRDWFTRNQGDAARNCACCNAGTLTPESAAAQAAAIEQAIAMFDELARDLHVLNGLIASRDQCKQAALAAIDALEVAETSAAERVAIHAGDVDPVRQYAALRRNADGWIAVRAAREQAEAATVEADTAEMLATACKQVVGELLDGAIGAFEARVQSFLPKSDVFRLKLRDGDREVCRMGFEREGQLHTALSGAEWARLCLALACAVAKGPGPIVVVPEERAFDPKTLRDVLVAFRQGVQRLKVPVQIIWTSPIKPSGRSTGWHVIDLDAATSDADAPAASVGGTDDGADDPPVQDGTETTLVQVALPTEAAAPVGMNGTIVWQA